MVFAVAAVKRESRVSVPAQYLPVVRDHGWPGPHPLLAAARKDNHVDEKVDAHESNRIDSELSAGVQLVSILIERLSKVV